MARQISKTVAKFSLVAAAAALPLLTAQGSQAAVVTVGATTLLANNSAQTFPILVTGSDLVAGSNFIIQIGDGGPDNGGTSVDPTITAITMTKTGTVFSTDNTGDNLAYSPDGLLGMDNIVTQTSGMTVTTVPDSGVLAYVTLNTTGFSAGTEFTVSLADDAAGIFGAPGDSTQLLTSTSAPFDPSEPGDGTVPVATITLVNAGVPEPTSIGLIAAAAGGLLCRRRSLSVSRGR